MAAKLLRKETADLVDPVESLLPYTNMGRLIMQLIILTLRKCKQNVHKILY